jgi:hypothetical protein
MTRAYLVTAAWASLFAVPTYLFVNTLLMVYLAIVHQLPLGFAAFTVVWTIRLPIAITLFIALLVGGHFLRRAVPVNRRIAAGFAAGAVALTLVVVFGAAVGRAGRTPNRYGFYSSWEPNGEIFVQAPHVPDIVFRTNSLGYRDHEWKIEAEEGVRRALIVGDSFVFGQGIADEADLLARQTRSALEATTGDRWEVIDVSMLPSALDYYVDALVTVGAGCEARASDHGLPGQF